MEKDKQITLNGVAEKKLKNIFTDGPISPSFIAASIEKHSSMTNIGAHTIFLGQVRSDVIDEKQVAAIEYSSYETMALEKMHQIREEMFRKYTLTCLHVHHSLGTVKAGEISLFVFTSSAHRKAATEACSEIVERIKKELPIWGKEIFVAVAGQKQTHKWKENF